MNAQPHIACPHCGSTDTELFSLFGQQLMTVQYYCHGCRTPFERVKGRDVIADAVQRAADDAFEIRNAGSEENAGPASAG